MHQGITGILMNIGKVDVYGPKNLVVKMRVLPKKITRETVRVTPDADCNNRKFIRSITGQNMSSAGRILTMIIADRKGPLEIPKQALNACPSLKSNAS